MAFVLAALVGGVIGMLGVGSGKSRSTASSPLGWPNLGAVLVSLKGPLRVDGSPGWAVPGAPKERSVSASGDFGRSFPSTSAG